jgi:hypothetical protein
VLGEIASQFAQGRTAELQSAPFSLARFKRNGMPALLAKNGLLRPLVMREVMRRLFNMLVNNVREHFMIYLALWLLLAIIDLVWLWFF